MRSFTAILLALSLPLCALAAHGNARRHSDLAHRARGDVLNKRDFSGRLTFYDIEVGITACGGRYSPSDFVVALNGGSFGSGYPGPHCGQTIILTANGKTAPVKVVDKCPGCPEPGGLDLTRGLFQFFADLGVGVIQGTWHFAGDDSGPSKQPDPTTTTHKPKPSPSPSPEEPSSSPKPTPSSTSKPPPPPSTTSTSSKKESTTTSTSTTTTSTTTSKPHESSTPSPSPTPTSSLNPDGLAKPAGVIPSDGQSPQNLEAMNDAIIRLGTLVEACNGE